MAADKSQKQKRDDRRSNEKGKQSPFRVIDGSQFRKDKGRVVLRGDMVKDDAGAYAAFTEKGSSASQMTAAKVME